MEYTDQLEKVIRVDPGWFLLNQILFFLQVKNLKWGLKILAREDESLVSLLVETET